MAYPTNEGDLPVEGRAASMPVTIMNESVTTTGAGGAGDASAANQTTQIAAEQAIQATAGAVGGAAVITDANGTLQQYLRGIVKLLITSGTIILGTGTNTIGATRDAGPSWTSAHGIASIPFTSADAQTAVAVTSAPTSGQKLVITDLIVSNNSAVALQFTFQEETSATVITGPIALPAGTSVQLTPRSKGWKLPVVDKKLFVDVSAAGNVMIDAHYFSEA